MKKKNTKTQRNNIHTAHKRKHEKEAIKCYTDYFESCQTFF